MILIKSKKIVSVCVCVHLCVCVCVCLVLQGTVNQQVVGQRAVKQTCNRRCSGYCYYRWYRGNQQSAENYLGCSFSAAVWIDSTSSSNQDRYSCLVNYAQPTSDCKYRWGVTYTPDSVCALEGSSVDLFCSYKHPGGLRVTESFWLVWPRDTYVDLLLYDQYKGRVQYNQTQCRMRITGLRANDARTYWFRFITDDPDGIYTVGSGVRLSVTGLKIEVLNTQGGGKQLICSSTCTLTNPTYIWYRNGQPVSEQNRAVLDLRDRTVDAGSYSCAVKEHEEIRSAAVYPPRPPSLSEFNGFNGSITLVCVSDSNPASSYTWFRKTGSSSEPFRNGSNLTLAAGTAGVFYCLAENQYGSSNSSELQFTSADWWKQYAVWAAVGLVPALALSLLTAVLCVQ
ncbi:hemicentin-1-like [Astyanax mexicanus]|uniref:Hemicentin-1-like n=1 Tax=Astyanax mexicanus TaxID=7994 RepID=A0A8T2LJQ2_ASTMX|nr:hemicentin-1-like [Astyanax mexicanus]